MNLIPAQDIKRRGISAVDELIRNEPVFVVKNNTPKYVVMMQSDYEQMVNDLAEARLAASEADLKAGRITRGTAADLMRDIGAGE